MKNVTILRNALLTGVALIASSIAHPSQGEQSDADEAQVITLKPDATGLKFDVTEFTVTTGAPVRIVFDNSGPVPLQHNVLVVKPGTLEKIGALADQMLTDPKAMEKQYIPESDDILHHTKLVNPGEKAELEFKAPDESGSYPYLCTFPGHWRLMQGVMKVEAAE